MAEMHYVDISVKVDVCDSLVHFNGGGLKAHLSTAISLF